MRTGVNGRIKPEDLLAEVEDILRTMPPRATLRLDTPENLSWLGRVVAIIARWNPAQGVSARAYLAQFHGTGATDVERGYRGLMNLLNEARGDLRMTTLGPVNTAIGHGLVFDYFDEIRAQITLAKADLLFVDPYLDADFVSRYLPHVPSGVSIRLLARERLNTLVPAAQLFAQQNKAGIQVRSAPNFHDRYMIVDGATCFQSGASFKDGGRTAPTTITQITDAFNAVRQTYEDLWQRAKPEL
jgi:hypothetical protein